MGLRYVGWCARILARGNNKNRPVLRLATLGGSGYGWGMHWDMTITTLRDGYSYAKTWVFRDEHRRRARALLAELRRAFTEHPEATDETYFEHLWFTLSMSFRFFITTLVILIHGIFPFLMVRTASIQIEAIYRIMKSRIPKARREAIDADYQV